MGYTCIYHSSLPIFVGILLECPPLLYLYVGLINPGRTLDTYSGGTNLTVTGQFLDSALIFLQITTDFDSKKSVFDEVS